MGKGTIGLNPFFHDGQIMSKSAMAGLLSVIISFTDVRSCESFPLSLSGIISHSFSLHAHSVMEDDSVLVRHLCSTCLDWMVLPHPPLGFSFLGARFGFTPSQLRAVVRHFKQDHRALLALVLLPCLTIPATSDRHLASFHISPSYSGPSPYLVTLSISTSPPRLLSPHLAHLSPFVMLNTAADLQSFSKTRLGSCSSSLPQCTLNSSLPWTKRRKKRPLL